MAIVKEKLLPLWFTASIWPLELFCPFPSITEQVNISDDSFGELLRLAHAFPASSELRQNSVNSKSSVVELR